MHLRTGGNGCLQAFAKMIKRGLIGTLQQHQKLVAAQPRHGVAFAQRAFQPLGDFSQQLVACGVAHGVVDVLEAVQVDEHQADFAAFALGALGGQQQALHE